MRALLMLAVVGGLLALGCERRETPAALGDAPSAAARPTARNHASNLPPLHPTNIVSIASGSEDHTTLVAALKGANYVTSVAASGPLTVFAPTNEAFDQLPPGTVEGLLEPENVGDLRELLKYHVTTSSLALASFQDGQSLGMANGARATIHVEDGVVSINEARVIASFPASNGMLHVIDEVLLPPAKQ